MPDRYYTADTLQADRSIGYLIKRCGVLMNQIAERAFESQPISFTHWIILMWLANCPRSSSPTELSAHTGYDMGAITRIVDHLERAGLVLRERSQHDRRAVEIAITPEGRRLCLGGKSVVVDLLNKLLTPYSRTEIEGFISLLQKFMAQMQQYQIQCTANAIPPAEQEHPSVTRVRRSKHQVQRADSSEPRTTRRSRTPRRKSME